VLEVMQGPQAGTRFRLEPGRTVVGRHPSCGLVLDAVSVSRQHAALEVEGNQAWIEDLGSRNGTAVDGRRISGRHALIDGQHLRIVDTDVAQGLQEGFAGLHQAGAVGLLGAGHSWAASKLLAESLDGCLCCELAQGSGCRFP
jgi:pSer/pThr/pTyr-binding forkhead associated (FHA) protein